HVLVRERIHSGQRHVQLENADRIVQVPGLRRRGHQRFLDRGESIVADVAQGGSAPSTISTAVTSGVAQTVALSASGVPAGATVSFSPSSVTAGSASTMTFTAAAATTPGTYPVNVTGTAASGTHSTTVSVTVTGVTVPDFSIAVSPASASVAAGSSAPYTV